MKPEKEIIISNDLSENMFMLIKTKFIGSLKNKKSKFG